MSEPKVDLNRGIVVSDDVRYYTPREKAPPRGVKLNILGRGGVQNSGEWRDDVGFVAWAPLVKTTPSVKMLQRACYLHQELADWKRYILPRGRDVETGSVEELTVMAGVLEQSLRGIPGHEKVVMYLLSDDPDPLRWSQAFDRGNNLQDSLGLRFKGVLDRIETICIGGLGCQPSAEGRVRVAACLDMIKEASVAEKVLENFSSPTDCHYVHFFDQKAELEVVWIGPGPTPSGYFRMFET